MMLSLRLTILHCRPSMRSIIVHFWKTTCDQFSERRVTCCKNFPLFCTIMLWCILKNLWLFFPVRKTGKCCIISNTFQTILMIWFPWWNNQIRASEMHDRFFSSRQLLSNYQHKRRCKYNIQLPHRWQYVVRNAGDYIDGQ